MTDRAARPSEAAPPPDLPDPDHYAVGTDASEAEFLAVCRVYARDVVSAAALTADVGALEWSVSRRAKRRAGQVRYRDGDPEAVVLTWGHFRARGWAAVADTLRHELVHVHLLNEYGDGSHGERFERWAERLDTDVHCELFTRPEWWVVCEACDAALARYRESKLVRRVDDYQCGSCGGRLHLVDGDDTSAPGDGGGPGAPGN